MQRDTYLNRIVLTAVVTLLASTGAADTVESNFEDGTFQGWTFTGDVDVAAVMPGGPADSNQYLEVIDLGEGPTILAWSPAPFLGDWSIYDGVGTLSADVGLLGYVVGGNTTVPMVFYLSGPGGSARHVFTLPPDGPWLEYRVPVREDDWTLLSGSWAGLMSNVTQFYVQAEFGTGLEIVGIDNVRLTSDPIIRWWTIDGGGGNASNGDLALRGTMSQMDAAASTHDDVTLRGGFWTVGGSPVTPCFGDTDGSGAVDVTDLLTVLGEWGACPACAGDVNGDDVVDVTDLLAILGAWGPCP